MRKTNARSDEWINLRGINMSSYDTESDDVNNFIITDIDGQISDSILDDAADEQIDADSWLTTMTPPADETMTSTASEVAPEMTLEKAPDRPIVIPPCFFTCSATAKDSVVAMKDADKIKGEFRA